MLTLPEAIIKRKEIDLRLGVKSSLKDVKEFFATYIAFYLANQDKSQLEYSIPHNARIEIHPQLLRELEKFFHAQISTSAMTDFKDKVNKTVFFHSQIEPLQVALELNWKLGKIVIVENGEKNHNERKKNTEGVLPRNPKCIHFSINAIILKNILSNYDGQIDDNAKNILFNWLTGHTLPINHNLENKLLETLNCFSEETQYKLIVDDEETIFQQEGIYTKILDGHTVISRGNKENNELQGPFRILKNFVKFSHPYLKDNSEFDLKDGVTLDSLREYKNKVSIYLDLLTRKTTTVYLHTSSPNEDENEKEALNLDPEGLILDKYKNILLKGVPGTGKSHLVNNLITNMTGLTPSHKNVKRINIHSASSNADLMQGIGIGKGKDENIIYSEKRGLIIEHIRRACFSPKQAFVLVLEEIQENSLNELIGDLIYLIEPDKRAKIQDSTLSGNYTYKELIEKYINESIKKKAPITYVEIPNLVEGGTEYRKMIMPDNLYIFCTSNYRDDKKVIEDNLLRRFNVIEMYPEYGKFFKSKHIAEFLKILNKTIVNEFSETEIHPDRFLIGHANWYKIEDGKLEEFYIALLKVFVEFKEIKEIDFNLELKNILNTLNKHKSTSWVFDSFRELMKALDKDYSGYKQWVELLQCKAYEDLIACTKEKESSEMEGEAATSDLQDAKPNDEEF